MLSKTGKTPSELLAEIKSKYGTYEMVENNLKFKPEQKDEILNIVMTERKLPEFASKVVRVNYEDGCKVYFEDDSFVICRFSGTEPLLRIFAESSKAEKAEGYILAWKEFLGL
jgi:phosphomannomutase